MAGAIGLSGPAATAQDIPDRTIRVGFAAHSIELGALFGQLREGFRAHLDAAGVKYEFFQAAPDASSDHAGMLRILEDMAALGLDYLVVGPTSLQLNEPGLETVAAAGTKLLMTDYTRPDEGFRMTTRCSTGWSTPTARWASSPGSGWATSCGRVERSSRTSSCLGPAASEISEQRGQGALKGLGSHADLKPEDVCERVVVLRVGRVAGTVLTSQSEKGDVVGLIMGEAT